MTNFARIHFLIYMVRWWSCIKVTTTVGYNIIPYKMKLWLTRVCTSGAVLSAKYLGDTSFIISFRKRNFPTSAWKLASQRRMQRSSMVSASRASRAFDEWMRAARACAAYCGPSLASRITEQNASRAAASGHGNVSYVAFTKPQNNRPMHLNKLTTQV